MLIHEDMGRNVGCVLKYEDGTLRCRRIKDERDMGDFCGQT